jgi:hypothetical protein
VLIQVSSGGVNTALAARLRLRGRAACAERQRAGETLDIPVLQPGSIYYIVVEGWAASAATSTSVTRWTGDRSTTTAPAPRADRGRADHRRDHHRGARRPWSHCGTNNRPDVAFRFTVPAGPTSAPGSPSATPPSIRPSTCTPAAAAAPSWAAPRRAAHRGARRQPGRRRLPGVVEADDAGAGTFDILLELLAEVPPPGNDLCAGAES